MRFKNAYAKKQSIVCVNFIFVSIFMTETMKRFLKLLVKCFPFTGERFKTTRMVIVQSKMLKLAWNWFS